VEKCGIEGHMKPWKVLATEGKWTLRQRDTEFMVQENGKILVTSRSHGGEVDLARIGCARIMGAAPKVLIGGLGFGFTLRAALDALPDLGKIIVSDPSAAVVAWNQGPLAKMHGDALGDPRVTVEVGDVQRVLSKHRGGFDVVLLDLDNGPFPVDIRDQESLFSIGGMSSVRASLKSGGRLAVWSATTHPGFNKRLREVGFTASVEKTGSSLVFIGDV
jgi:spermidine synthase